MIIAPDFFEHWKTKALIELTKRPESPLWVQRLWAHCQTRKQWEFKALSQLALKSICGVTGDITPAQWWEYLLQTGFTRQVGQKLIAHDWDEHNAQLIARWAGGGATAAKHKGGSGKAAGKQRTGDREDGGDGKDKRDRKAHATRPLPTFAEVTIYGESISMPEEEALKFFDHFTANGWKQASGNLIKDWQAAARNWLRRSGAYGKKMASGYEPRLPFDPDRPHAHTGGLEVLGEEARA